MMRLLRALGYLFTGRINKFVETLSTNPNVMKAQYDSIIADKKGRVNEYKDAIAGMVMQESKKKAELEGLVAGIQKTTKLKSAALAKAKALVAKNGGDIDKAKKDADYLTCMKAYGDFSSTLKEKEERADGLENDIETYQANIAKHEAQIKGLMRDLENIKQEKHDAVADVISSKEEKEIADMLSGLSEDRSSEELAKLREARTKAKAEADVSQRLSGLDAKHEESEFLEFAEASEAESEFEALLMAASTESGDSEASEATKELPEV